VLNDYTLAKDLDRQFGDVPVGLGKMFLSAIHGSDTTGFACRVGSQNKLARPLRKFINIGCAIIKLLN
jgi:hypothetical protein